MTTNPRKERFEAWVTIDDQVHQLGEVLWSGGEDHQRLEWKAIDWNDQVPMDSPTNVTARLSVSWECVNEAAMLMLALPRKAFHDGVVRNLIEDGEILSFCRPRTGRQLGKSRLAEMQRELLRAAGHVVIESKPRRTTARPMEKGKSQGNFLL